MNLTKTAIERPVFVLMVMLATIVFGLLGYSAMRKEQNPDVSFGTISILAIYPGANPEEVATLVSRPLEEAVSGVNGLREVTSTSVEGRSVVILQFELTQDIDIALNDVRTKVDAAVPLLPDDVEKPTISKIDTSSTPVLYYAVSSQGLSSRDLRTLVDDKLKDRFARIAGVSEVGIQGGDIRELQVQVKKDQMLRYGVGLADIRNAIAGATQNIPSGRIVSGDEETTVRVPGEFTKPQQLEDLVFSVSDPKNPMGRNKLVRLQDVATVRDATQERTQYSTLDGKDTIVIVIQKAREGNAIEIAKGAEGVVEKLQEEYGNIGLKFVKTQDEATRVEEGLFDLNLTLYFSIFLVGLIVYIFLHDWRGTLIVALAIPVCLFATFAAYRVFGFTINNLSTLALSLAIAVLVDDAIVVLENIYRHLKMGEDPREASINGRAEIGIAAIAITLADVVVFLPLAFVGGVVGQFFRPLALGYVMAVLFSLFVSFTLTPMLASRWYRAGEDVENPKGAFARWFEKRFHGFENWYRRVLQFSLRHRWPVFVSSNVVLFAVFLIIGGSNQKSYGDILAPGPFMGFFMFSAVLGMLVFSFTVYRKFNQPRTGFIIYGVSALIGTALVLFAKMPIPVAIGTTFVGPIIPAIILNIYLKVERRPSANFWELGSGFVYGSVFLLAGFLGFFLVSVKQESLFKFSFFPSSDTGNVRVNIQLPPGRSLEATQRVVSEVERRLEGIPEIEFKLATVGSQGVSQFQAGTSGSNYAQVVVSLYEKEAILDTLMFWKKHEETLRTRSTNQVIAQMIRQVGRIPGAEINVAQADTFGIGSAIQMSFSGNNREELIEVVSKLKRGLKAGAVPGVINPDLSSKPGKPELRAEPDRTRLADAGLTVGDLAAALRIAYTGDDTVKYREAGREYVIRTMLDLDDRNDPNILSELPIRFRQGEPVYVDGVATLTPGTSTDKIERRNRAEEVRLTADLLPGFAAGTTQAAIDSWIAREKLVPASITIKPLGQAESQAREQAALGGALLFGLLLVYMVLASLYNSLLSPLIIQLAQPQAFVGALLGLMILNKEFSLIGFIGLLTLIGLVGKNAILLVDYTNTLRSRGRERLDAILEAGPTRLRPIMMTSLALVIGLLPVALAIGRGSEFRETLGIVIIGGVTLSTILTLVVIPCSYTIFDDWSLWLGRIRRGDFSSPSGGDAPPVVAAPETPVAKV
ncbi:MAG: efflux RND transporter permease subunit [Fimbriimonadaceae bacterium]|nr:efflux RND transporter permease subunit [Fimbriimonadaceae bacterium]